MVGKHRDLLSVVASQFNMSEELIQASLRAPGRGGLGDLCG